MDTTDESKAALAVEWLELLGTCVKRLEDIEDDIAALEGDGVGAQFYKREVLIRGYQADKVGSMVASREERRAELMEERDLLTDAIANAKRLMVDAARCDDHMAVKGLRYVWARYLHGLTHQRVSDAMGVSRGMAYLYRNRFIARLVEAYPSRFDGDRRPYGYYEFARGLSARR